MVAATLPNGTARIPAGPGAGRAMGALLLDAQTTGRAVPIREAVVHRGDVAAMPEAMAANAVLVEGAGGAIAATNAGAAGPEVGVEEEVATAVEIAAAGASLGAATPLGELSSGLVEARGRLALAALIVRRVARRAQPQAGA